MFKNNVDRRYSTLTDKEILLFVWKWRVVSMNLLISEFSKRTSRVWTYRRIQMLLKKKQIRYVHLEDFNGFGIALTKSGFLFVRNSIEWIEKFGFKSENPAHDFALSAVQYGLFQIHSDFFHSLITENELRNLSSESFAPGVPRSTVHRPDGYLVAGMKPTSGVVAIEIEFSDKNKSRYVQLADFYAKYPNVFGIWIAKNNCIATNIANAISANAILKGKRHLIFEWEDLIENGWNAKTKHGAIIGTKLSEFVPNNCNPNTVQERSKWTLNDLLSTKKRPKFSDSCKPKDGLNFLSVPGAHSIAPSLNITPTTTDFDPSIIPNNKEELPHE